jgi:peptidoglycan/LPS O-acetylase OafA/YrhL
LETTTRTQLIGTLHGLRGIAALTVVIAHSRGMTGVPLPSVAGSMGVLLFFALSGFLMAHLYMRSHPSAASVVGYLRARFARIYPLFAIVCLASTVIFYLISQSFPYQMDVSQLAKHLLGAGALMTIWTISAELQFYAIFVVIWLAYSQLGNNRDLFFSLGIVSVIAVLYSAGFPGGRIAITGYLQVFLVGTLAAIALPYFTTNKGRLFAAIALPALIGVYVTAYFVVPVTIGGRWVYHSMPLVVAMGALVLSAVLAAESTFGRLLSSPPMLWMGEVSFGIYLLHRPVMFFMNRVFPDDLHWTLSLALLLCLVGVAAQLAYTFIERPSRYFIRYRLGSSKLAASTVQP